MREQIGVKIIEFRNYYKTIYFVPKSNNNLFNQQTRDQFTSLMNFIHIAMFLNVFYNMTWRLGVKYYAIHQNR